MNENLRIAVDSNLEHGTHEKKCAGTCTNYAYK